MRASIASDANTHRRRGDGTMKFKMIGSGIAALALLATSFSARPPIFRGPVYKGVRSVIAYYNWTGFYAGINAGYGWGTSDWASVRRQRCVEQPQRIPGRRHARLQLPDRLVRLGPRGRPRLVRREGQRQLRPRPDLRNRQPLARHRARPARLRLRPLPAVHHRRRRLRRRPGERQSRSAASARATRGSAGPSAPASNTPSSATGPPRSNTSTSISAASTPASPRRSANNVSFKENIVRAGLNYKFSGPIFTRW